MMNKSCLFVVDVQNGFVSQATDYVVKRINSLLAMGLFDYVIFTRFINSQGSPYMRYLKWDKFLTGKEIEIVDILKPFAKNVVDKHIYSGINENVLKFIQSNNISTAFICGIDTDCCVLATALDLFENNIHPVVLSYYSASNGGKKSHQAALTIFSRLIGMSNVIEESVDKQKIMRYLLVD